MFLIRWSSQVAQGGDTNPTEKLTLVQLQVTHARLDLRAYVQPLLIRRVDPCRVGA